MLTKIIYDNTIDIGRSKNCKAIRHYQTCTVILIFVYDGSALLNGKWIKRYKILVHLITYHRTFWKMEEKLCNLLTSTVITVLPSALGFQTVNINTIKYPSTSNLLFMLMAINILPTRGVHVYCNPTFTSWVGTFKYVSFLSAFPCY